MRWICGGEKMKKYISFNSLLFAVFLIATMITLFIIYREIDTPLSTKFIVGYVVFLLVYGIYMIFGLMMNMRGLSWLQIGKRLLIFLIWFVSLNVGQYLFYYFFNPSELAEWGVWNFGTPLGLSFALAFSDLMFKKNKN
jgi:hypothetical protein